MVCHAVIGNSVGAWAVAARWAFADCPMMESVAVSAFSGTSWAAKSLPVQERA
jgi:hypothetical protein